MSFLYYLPKYQGTPTPAKMLAAGLGYAFDQPGLHSCETRSGPDASGGVVAATSSVPQQWVRFDPSQQWRRIPGNESGAWVGMWTDDARKPTPKSLAREEMVIGLDIELEDGNKWRLPVACKWTEGRSSVERDTWLPRVRVYSEAGTWEPGPVSRRYRRLWDEVAVPYADALVSSIESEERKAGEIPSVVTFDYDMDSLLVACLQENYRVGPCEISMLEAFTAKSAIIAGDVLIDAQGYVLLKKKQQQDASEPLNSDCGPGHPTEAK